MAYITTSVEYGIHCLPWLVGDNQRALSSRELAELQGISPAFWPRFSSLEKAGIVAASEGVRGGYRLARPSDEISFLEIIETPLKGTKPLFDYCRRCAGAVRCSTIPRRIGRFPAK